MTQIELTIEPNGDTIITRYATTPGGQLHMIGILCLTPREVEELRAAFDVQTFVNLARTG